MSESNVETYNAVLTFESVEEILWCDHVNEMSLVYFWYHLFFNILQNVIWVFALSGVEGLQ